MTGWISNEWKRLTPYFSLLDFTAPPSTRVAWVVRGMVMGFAVVVLFTRARSLTAPLLRAKPPIPVPTEEIEDYRFRLPERTRREIFAVIAENEQQQRATAIASNSWNGHLWSREDDRGHFERVFFRQVAKRFNISLSQVYLVQDEGIRAHWPGPDGEPLPATVPPLNPRQTW
ncbi:MAG: hypothetical protein JWP97_2743 [Labilithrix sp.]|nr:hypothetical protein [Labilithrix sp.]